MPSTRPKKNFPDKDPYDVLGIDPGASDAEIAKAYRKLALAHHPDKQQQGLTDLAQKKQSEIKFQEIQQARSFLLDAEHEHDRRHYAAKRASEQMRQQADAAREKGMSDRRKRMRQELKQQEEEARLNQKRKYSSSSGVVVEEKLRRKGAAMRQAYAERNVREAAEDAVKQKRQLQNRQIRLKWSRKKMESQSEHSIAAMLTTRFGAVEAVELLGSKGNAALVTFASPESCEPCVKAYADSDEMRAKYVGEQDRQKEEQDAVEKKKSSFGREERDREDVDDWKLRRAAEREILLREMEHREEGVEHAQRADSVSQRKRTTTTPFPPPFPDTDEFRGLTPWEKLEKAEASVLKDILSAETITI